MYHLQSSMPAALLERFLLTTFANATAAAALACAHTRGRGLTFKELADQQAVTALETVLNAELLIPAEVVIGEGERDEAPMLYRGQRLGPHRDQPAMLDIAVDPLENTNACARGEYGATCVIAAAIRGEGRLLSGADGYMDKLILSKETVLKIDRLLGSTRWQTDNTGLFDMDRDRFVDMMAAALNKKPSELVTIILERERNEQLIEELRRKHVQINLIRDGDLTAGLLTLDDERDIDFTIGIGAAPEGVITATATRVLRGYMEARWWHNNRRDAQLLRTNDLSERHVMFAMTAVTDNAGMPGIRYQSGGAAKSHTIYGRSRSGSFHQHTTTHLNPPPPPTFGD